MAAKAISPDHESIYPLDKFSKRPVAQVLHPDRPLLTAAHNNMSAFSMFPRLPAEMRALIWTHSIEPRTVDVRAFQGTRGQRGGPNRWRMPNEDPDPDLYTTVPPPAVMQTCQESRDRGLYEKVTYWHPASDEQRYAWINFEVDMIDVGAALLESIKHLAPRIRRLRFQRSNVCECWYHDESTNLTWFGNVELYHVVVPDWLSLWFAGWEEHFWACKKENLVFIYKKTGQMLNAIELQEMEDANLAEIERQGVIDD